MAKSFSNRERGRMNRGGGPTGNARTPVVAVVTLVLALGLWYAVFVLPGNFWVKMAGATLCLAFVAVTQREPGRIHRGVIRLRHVALGVGSALLLYVVFLVGRMLLIAITPQAQNAIAAVYDTREALPLWAIALMLLFVTSPCEEIYWRGFIQRVLTRRLGRRGGYLAATFCYAGVHVVTLNVPLVLAALTAGLMWGWIYMREGTVVPGIISHSLWATAIFVLFPVA